MGTGESGSFFEVTRSSNWHIFVSYFFLMRKSLAPAFVAIRHKMSVIFKTTCSACVTTFVSPQKCVMNKSKSIADVWTMLRWLMINMSLSSTNNLISGPTFCIHWDNYQDSCFKLQLPYSFVIRDIKIRKCSCNVLRYRDTVSINHC